MPVTINDTVIMDDTGKFTQDFKPSMLGEEYAESKMFETTPDILTLMKAAHGLREKVSKKMENIIEKPGPDAPDNVKAEYFSTLKKELGAPDSPDEYEFPAPEGYERNEELEKLMRNLFHKAKIPKSDVETIVKEWNDYQVQIHEAQQKEVQEWKDKEEAQFKNEVDTFKSTHAGNNLVEGSRIALKAMLKYADDDLKKILQEGKFIEDPTQFDKMREKGIWPSQLAVWERIGRDLKTDDGLTPDGIPTGTEPTPGTREAVVSSTYNHPTSVADRRARGLRY